jgi:CheY-like chemotaxis protein
LSDPNSDVLVVDDDESVRDSVADLLASTGFALQRFGSAAELIRANTRHLTYQLAWRPGAMRSGLAPPCRIHRLASTRYRLLALTRLRM